MFMQNISVFLLDCMALHPRQWHYSSTSRSFEFIITWFYFNVTIHQDGDRVEHIET
jgi:hypothetical protein